MCRIDEDFYRHICERHGCLRIETPEALFACLFTCILDENYSKKHQENLLMFNKKGFPEHGRD